MRIHLRRTVVAVLVAVAVLAGGTAIAQSVQRFSDVPADHPQADAINWAADTGLTVGYGDGTFRPDEPLPRWAALIFMERFYDRVLSGETGDFTRGDMMTVLYGMVPAVTTTTTTVPDSTDAADLSEHPYLQDALARTIAVHPALADFITNEIRYVEDRVDLCGWESNDCYKRIDEVPTVIVLSWDAPSAVYVFVHEIGHAVEDEFGRLSIAVHGTSLDEGARELLHHVGTAFRDDCAAITDYACTNRQEYSAEAFAASVLHPHHIRMGITDLSTAWVDHMVKVVTTGPCARMIRTEVSANGFVPRCGVQRHADGTTTVCDPWCE